MPTLQDGKEAIDRGNLQQARLIFEAILQENPRDEDAWFELGNVLVETQDKRICYENVLKLDQEHQAAREALRNLEPEADPLRQQFQLEQAIEKPEPDGDDEDGTLVSERPEFETAEESDKETPTALLVAVGLALSVVVFAVGGGIIFILITTLTGR